MDNNNLVEDLLSIIKVQSQDISVLEDKVVALTAKLDSTDDEMRKYLNIVNRLLTLSEEMNTDFASMGKDIKYILNVYLGKYNTNRGFPPTNVN